MSIQDLTNAIEAIRTYQDRRTASPLEAQDVEQERVAVRERLRGMHMKLGAFDDDLRPFPKAFMDEVSKVTGAPAPETKG